MPGLGLEAVDIRGGESLRLLVLEGHIFHHPVPGFEHAVHVLHRYVGKGIDECMLTLIDG